MGARGGQKFKYSTADEFKQACQRYFDWCDKNPIHGAMSVRNKNKQAAQESNADKAQQVKSNEFYPRPYTIEGLCDELTISNWTMFVKQNKDREGFGEVIEWARNKIRRNQIEGGMVGIYQPSLTARLNGLAENINTNELPPMQFLADEDE